MLRSVCVLLTVCSLLACPLTCMPEAVGASAAAPQSADACSCCCQHHSPDETADDSDLPVPHDTGDQCTNCLCHGALVTKNDLGLGTDVAACLDAFQAVLVVDAAAAESQRPAPGIDASPPGTRSGRLIRYEMQSLLL